MSETTTPETPAGHTPAFLPRVDAQAPDRSTRCTSRLAETGAVIVRGLHDRSRFRALAQELMTPYAHPDSDPDGITVIRATEAAPGPGRRGFCTAELRPHTERSGTLVPPHFLMLGCLTPATDGGQTLLVDGRAVFDDLARSRPDALEALTAERSAYFGGASGHAGAVFERAAAGRWTVRLRLDELARFSPRIAHHLPAFCTVLEAHTQVLRLDAGDAVLVDNSRWLHGRRPFSGDRRMLRALGDARPNTPMSRGFYSC